MAQKCGSNGCGPSKTFMGNCGQRGNKLLETLDAYKDENVPRVVAWNGDVSMQDPPLIGMTGNNLTMNYLTSLLQDRGGNNTGPSNQRLPAPGAQPLVVDYAATFPNIVELGTFYRFSYVFDVPDQPIEIEKRRTHIDGLQTLKNFTLSLDECNSGGKSGFVALDFNDADLGGTGEIVPVNAVTTGDQIQNAAAYTANGQQNLYEIDFSGAEDTGITLWSLNRSHRWVCEMFRNVSKIMKDIMASELGPYEQEAYDRVASDIRAKRNGYPSVQYPNGMPVRRRRVPNGNGYARNGGVPNGNGYARNGGVPNNGYKMNGDGVYVPLPRIPVMNTRPNGFVMNGKNGGTPQQTLSGPNGPVKVAINGNGRQQPYQNYAMYTPQGVPVPINMPYHNGRF